MTDGCGAPAQTASLPATVDLANEAVIQGTVVRGGEVVSGAYARLLGRITALGAPIPVMLKRDLLSYYGDPAAPITTKKDKEAWNRVQEELTTLKTMPVIRRDFDPEELSEAGTEDPRKAPGETGW